jgi:hypothetical protein
MISNTAVFTAVILLTTLTEIDEKTWERVSGLIATLPSLKSIHVELYDHLHQLPEQQLLAPFCEKRPDPVEERLINHYLKGD